jgi:YidC/Oxa1 family membrane protein insertase
MDIIVNLFVTVLTVLYSILANNMVLAIVVFTIIVRLLTYPLTARQLRSAQAMRTLQPELKKIQEKYKGQPDERQKMAEAQMALYRQHGISPLGGCLPLLIQLPILIALYQAIILALAANPIQLLDLSGRLIVPGIDGVIPLDNRFLGMNLTLPPNIAAGGLEMVVGIVLIALVVITTWLQFKLTTPAPEPSPDGKPNPAASATQSMGTIMPLMYGFFALNFSIGLSVYFIVSNVIGIVQAALMGTAKLSNLFSRPKPAPAAATVAGKVTTPSKTTTPPAARDKNAPRLAKSAKSTGRK